MMKSMELRFGRASWFLDWNIHYRKLFQKENAEVSWLEEQQVSRSRFDGSRSSFEASRTQLKKLINQVSNQISHLQDDSMHQKPRSLTCKREVQARVWERISLTTKNFTPNYHYANGNKSPNSEHFPAQILLYGFSLWRASELTNDAQSSRNESRLVSRVSIAA